MDERDDYTDDHPHDDRLRPPLWLLAILIPACGLGAVLWLVALRFVYRACYM